jgi:hypothetical protein
MDSLRRWAWATASEAVQHRSGDPVEVDERGLERRGYRRGHQHRRARTALSRSALSRLVKRLQELFRQRRDRGLGQERYRFLIGDVLYLGVCLARRWSRCPPRRWGAPKHRNDVLKGDYRGAITHAE